ncbi:hypothetical protein FQP90_22120 [Paenarthrobacter nitroguajacolicus]|uniref:Uncharacterized protein n=1 Tax=Paenarthrobacter nitroguajacolicus TaxID=211146 RepID=A0A558GMI8_PAENT|nr:hypothetical protein [Paenarthrobacter nitroguajacolicus]TVU58100.1 hypothetical protein FQP90_22120 [Paenarthrobacter nitroguajacolicus]
MSADNQGVTAAERSWAVDFSARIHNKHAAELNELRTAMTEAPRRGEPRHLGRRQHRLGPLQSFEDASVQLTMVAESVELGWFTVGPAPAGMCLTVSIAAHQKDTGIQTSLPLTECDAWLQALLGGQWMLHAYRCGCATGAASENVVSYRLYLDAARKPIRKPEEVLADACLPLQP